MFVFLAILGLGGLYLWMLKPNHPRLEKMKPFEKVYIAHRGLFDPDKGIPENSLAAFRRAVENGYGIELDIQITKDGKLVVFHDKTLKRMCGEKKILTQLTYQQLQEYRLAGSEERIPLFEDALKLIGGKVPLIVEVKAEGKCFKATRMMCRMMENYPGIFCMESFHPLCVRWVRKHYPKILRGQLSMNYFIEEKNRPFYQKLVMTSLLFNVFARPDFISYHHAQKNQFSYRLCRKLFKVENAAWTIKSQEQLDQARDTFQVMIFDGFIPKRDS